MIQSRWRAGQCFSLERVYEFEGELRKTHPGNNHVRDKIRQTLQYLRDDGDLSFVDRDGTYLRLR